MKGKSADPWEPEPGAGAGSREVGKSVLCPPTCIPILLGKMNVVGKSLLAANKLQLY